MVRIVRLVERISLFFLLVTPRFFLYATHGGSSDSGHIDNPLAYGSLYEFIAAIVEVIIYVAVPVSVFFIMYAGFLFVTAKGNETKLSTAKKAITWGLVGAAVLLGAWVLVEAVQGTIKSLQ